MNSLFTQSIRNFQEIFTENWKTVKYDTETVTYRERVSLGKFTH